jgi:hypothetical protein
MSLRLSKLFIDRLAMADILAPVSRVKAMSALIALFYFSFPLDILKYLSKSSSIVGVSTFRTCVAI